MQQANSKKVKSVILLVTGCFLLLLSGPCVIAPCTPQEAHDISTPHAQQKAYEKMRSGEHLTDSDIENLANTPIHISKEEARRSAWTAFGFGVVFLILPGLGCLYCYRKAITNSQNSDV